MFIRALILGAALAVAGVAQAGPADFVAGPVIMEFGKTARVPNAEPLPEGTHFKVVFDISEAGQTGATNRGIESAARFLNMNVAAGVPEENIELAIVAHGPAVRDLTRAADGSENPNAPLVAALIAHRVKIYVCGQTAAASDVKVEDLLPGVRLALSAMTELALLQQQGYTLQPF